MTNYRVYLVSAQGRVTSGQWVEAGSDAEAKRLAHEFCDEGSPTVEVWDGARRVGDLPCDEDADAA